MPPSKLPPTIRQRRLGAELRRLRELAQMSATDAGRLHGATQSRISNIESGGYPVSADRVRTLARLYGCADQPLIDTLAGDDRRADPWVVGRVPGHLSVRRT